MARPAEQTKSQSIVAWLAALTVAAPSLAQQGAPDVAADPAKAIATAAEQWLASDQVDTRLLDAAVLACRKAPKLAVDWLEPQLARTLKEPATPRSKGVQALCTQFAIDYVNEQRATYLVYVGQYDLLLRLQPYVGDLFFELLLAPNDSTGSSRSSKTSTNPRSSAAPSPPHCGSGGPGSTPKPCCRS